MEEEDVQQFCLRWHHHQSSVVGALGCALQSGALADVTLSAGGSSMRAHRLVLGSCSQYFASLFKELPTESGALVVVLGCSPAELRLLLTFMYTGEVTCSRRRLPRLLRLARSLRVDGLTDANSNQPDVPSLELDEEKDSETQDDPSLSPSIDSRLPDDETTPDPIEPNDDDNSENETATSNLSSAEYSHPLLSKSFGARETDMSKIFCATGTEKSNCFGARETDMSKIFSATGTEKSNCFGARETDMSRCFGAAEPLMAELLRRERPLDRLSRLDRIVQQLYSSHKDATPSGVGAFTAMPTPTTQAHPAANPAAAAATRQRRWRLQGAGGAGGDGGALCTVCNKRLSNQYNLRVHLETHAGARHACPACAHVSRSRDALRKHVAYRHPTSSTPRRSS